MVYNSDMADVWYPGRPPLRSPEIIEGLTHYIGALQVCSHQCAPEYLEKAERICDHVMDVLQDESDDCLGSDSDINSLLEMMPQTLEAAALCVQHDQWDDLEDITASVEAVKWALIGKLDEVTEQGVSDGGSDSTNVPRRPTPWTDGEEDAEQKHQAQAPTLSEFEAEEALPSSDEEGLATDPGTPEPALKTSPPPAPSSDTEGHGPPRTV